MNRKVKQIVEQRGLPIISEKMLLIDAVKHMLSNKLDSVLLINSKKQIVGIFTDNDIKKALDDNRDFSKDAVFSSATTSRLITINQEREMSFAVHLMHDNNIRHLPVVDELGNITGLITLKDIIEAEFCEFEKELEVKYRLAEVVA